MNISNNQNNFQPLEGIRVIDFSRVLAGPYCSMCLADMGADVIKIERIDGGDDTRRFGPPFVDTLSTYFVSINRGKRSLAIDLKNPDSRPIIEKLIADADVVLENFRPGAMTRLGYGKEQLWAMNPTLIYCSISAFGHRGDPFWSTQPGYDLIIQGMGGIPSITGAPDGPPSKVGASIADIVSGMNAFSGILLALLNRLKVSSGQHIDISMQEGQLALHTYLSTAWLNAGVEPPRNGNRHLSIAPYSTYEAKDGWLNIAVANEKLWRNFCVSIGRNELMDDERFVDNATRVTNITALDRELSLTLSTKNVSEWIEILRQAGIPAGPVLSIRQALEHPQLAARQLITGVSLGSHVFKTVGPAYGQPQRAPGNLTAPQLGEHTKAILNDLGYDNGTVDAWHQRGVVAFAT